MKKALIVCFLILSGFSCAANSATDTTNQEGVKDQKTKYEERKKWMEDRKYELLNLCDQLVNIHDFPKTNIEAERDKLKLKLRMYVKEIRDVDYADDKKFAAIQKKFDGFESCFRAYPEKLREKENKKW